VREGGGEVSDLRYMLLDYRCAATQYAEYYCQLVEDFVAKKDARIAQLEALIADAPHQSENCKVRWNAHSGDWEYDICSCWKSRALDTGANGEPGIAHKEA